MDTDEDGDRPEVDWTHLPPGLEAVPPWSSLLEGVLLSCVSDPRARTVTLAVRLADPETDDEVSLRLTLDEVRSARATVSVPPPDGPARPAPRSTAEVSRSIAAYRASWREESIAWSDFEAALAASPMPINDAALARADGQGALRLEGVLGDGSGRESACRVRIGFGAIDAALVDGEPFDLEASIRRARDDWDDEADGES